MSKYKLIFLFSINSFLKQTLLSLCIIIISLSTYTTFITNLTNLSSLNIVKLNNINFVGNTLNCSRLPYTNTNSFVFTWLSTLKQCPELVGLDFLLPTYQDNNYIKSLQAVSKIKMRPDENPPLGLAEFEYSLALKSNLNNDWKDSLEHLQKALVYKPEAWSKSFYTLYKEVISKVSKTEFDAINLEELEKTEINNANKIYLGKRETSWVNNPVKIDDKQMLESFAVLNPISTSLGFPSKIQLNLISANRNSELKNIQAQSFLSNSSFQLGKNWKNPDIFGWSKPNQAFSIFNIPDFKIDINSSLQLVGLPTNDTFNNLRSNIAKVKPGAIILWTVKVQTEESDGTPVIFITWLDEQFNRINTEVPLAGGVKPKIIKDYSSTLKSPLNAKYFYVTLANPKSNSKVIWYRLLFFYI